MTVPQQQYTAANNNDPLQPVSYVIIRDGNGGNGGGLDVRVAALESSVSTIKDDVKDIKSYIVKLIIALGVGFVLMATFLIGAYIRLDDKIEASEKSIIDQVIAKLG